MLRGWSEHRVGAVIVVDHRASMLLSRSHLAQPAGPQRAWQAPTGPVADLETLQWLMWSNSFDLRPGQFGWWAIERAVQLGARLPTALEQVSCEPMGDICTPEGRWCWIDAGPPRQTVHSRAAVISGVALEHGSLIPSGSEPARAELSGAQRAAVEEPSGSARVIAPAGSGKTRVLSERARHLLDVWRVPASAVTLLAFNRRARDELVERTADLPGLQIRTLNSIALAIVNGTAPFAPRPVQRRTIGEERSRAMMSEAISAVTGARPTEEMVDTYLEALVRIRLRMRSPHEVAEQFGERAPALMRVWVRYRAALERWRVVDFDGQIYLALDVLTNDPSVREQAQRSCRLLLVDEFQDLTPAHLALIQLLTGLGGSIYGVGDDDQTIYGYAGAQPEWLLGGGSGGAGHSPGATVPRHQLDVNHRCPPEVVSAVSELLEHNQRRAPKRIASAGQSSQHTAEGGLEIICSPDPLSDTVAAVLDAHRCGVPTSSIAVLARVNALLVPVHLELASMGIGVNARGSVQFAAHPVVARLRAWWALSTARPGARVDAEDLVSVLGDRIAGRAGEMGRDAGSSVASVHPAEVAERLLRRAGMPVDLRIRDLCSRHEGIGGSTTGIRAIMSTLESARAAVADGATTQQWLDIVAAHGVWARSQGPSDREPEHDHLTALRQLAIRDPVLAHYGEMIDSIGDLVSSDDGVVLSTIHRVKGLEWPMVVLHQADRSRMPHRLADDVEEERRIFHVGLTRSAERCVVVGGPDPSPFIAELKVGRP